MTVSWESINKGDILPELSKRPTLTQLVKYAAGSGDFNPLHHDYNFYQSKLIGSIVVHGKFKYASLGELISNWLGHKGWIKKITCHYKGMDFPDQEMTIKGKITRKYEENGEKCLDISVWVENAEGKVTTPGSAVVVFKK